MGRSNARTPSATPEADAVDSPEVEAVAPDQAADTRPEAPANEASPAPEGEASAPATPEQPAVDAAPDLTAFNAAVEESVREAAEVQGELPVADIDRVGQAYRTLDPKGKRAAKDRLGELMREAMTSLNAPLARAYMILTDKAAVAASSSSSAPKPPADPSEALAERRAALSLAYHLVEVPDGADDAKVDAKVAELTSQYKPADVAAYRAWQANTAEDKGDAPALPPIVLAALKLAGGKVGGARRASTPSDGTRRDIGAHIQQAFASKEAGTFMTIAEIVNTPTEAYAGTKPSAGAVSARLFPKSGNATVEGVKPEVENRDGKEIKGARKIA